MSKRITVLISLTGMLLIITVGYIYYSYDPSLYFWFPKCLLYTKTGIACPFCGTQRALHALLHFEILDALRFNAFVTILIPIILVQAVMAFTRKKQNHTSLINIKSSQVWFGLVILIIFTIIRNVI